MIQDYRTQKLYGHKWINWTSISSNTLYQYLYEKYCITTDDICITLELHIFKISYNLSKTVIHNEIMLHIGIARHITRYVGLIVDFDNVIMPNNGLQQIIFSHCGKNIDLKMCQKLMEHF